MGAIVAQCPRNALAIEGGQPFRCSEPMYRSRPAHRVSVADGDLPFPAPRPASCNKFAATPTVRLREMWRRDMRRRIIASVGVILGAANLGWGIGVAIALMG